MSWLRPWKLNIDLKDIFHNDELSFEQIRDETVKRLKDSGWLGLAEDEYEEEQLFNLFEELELTETPDEFDEVWSYVYDEADDYRVWIGTI